MRTPWTPGCCPRSVVSIRRRTPMKSLALSRGCMEVATCLSGFKILVVAQEFVPAAFWEHRRMFVSFGDLAFSAGSEAACW